MDTQLVWILGITVIMVIFMFVVIALLRRANDRLLDTAVFRLPALPAGQTFSGSFALPTGGYVDLWLDLSYLCKSAFSATCVVTLRVTLDGAACHEAEFALSDEGSRSPLLPPGTRLFGLNGSTSPTSDGRQHVSEVHNLCVVGGRPAGLVEVKLSVRPGEPGTEVQRATLLALPR